MSKSALDRWSVKMMYNRLKDKPLGLLIFSKLVGLMVPYTGTIKARVEKLEPGYALVSMKDRRRVRNHLKSIHAVALLNLGEFSTGLAVIYDLPSDSRAILKELSMEYLKKARGPLRAEGKCVAPDSGVRKEYVATSDIYDASNTVIARAKAIWLVGPKS